MDPLKTMFVAEFLSCREKAAHLILRTVGSSINLISEAFGRSISVVHCVLVKAERYGHNLDVWCRRVDIRKLPYQARMRLARAAKSNTVWGQTRYGQHYTDV